jgi:hypothetical protein
MTTPVCDAHLLHEQRRVGPPHPVGTTIGRVRDGTVLLFATARYAPADGV